MLRVLSILILIGCAFVAYWGAYNYFRADELAKTQARLSLYQSTVQAELRRFSHLTYVLSRDAFVIETARGGDTSPLDERFAIFAEKAEIDAIYLMDTDGLTRSASNAELPSSFVGQNYGFRPYFQAAMQGQRGEFYGIGATTGIPGYFFAEAVRDGDGTILGVVAIKLSLSTLQYSWQNAREQVILANADGIALLSSVPQWRYRALKVLTPGQRERIADARQFGTQTLELLDWRPARQDSAVIGNQTLLHLSTDALPNNWTLHIFAPDDQAETRALLSAGVVFLLAGLFFISYQMQRARRISEALLLSEREEATLREANERLAIEVEDRIAAEQRLQRTQTELERAGRLAALGQLASSVTHELGQPIAAMRNHLAAAELQAGGTGLNVKLQGLVDRMEGITRQLKFFSRKGRDQLEDVDLRQAMTAALELTEPTRDKFGAAVSFDAPSGPVILKANRLRIEQVMTNLLSNAMDAMDQQGDPKIAVKVGQDDGQVWFEVADNGHGLGDRTLSDLREPFATTRESGKGMGLGLTISAGIVDDHNGEMTAHSRETGGAVFRATFPTGSAGSAGSEGDGT